MSGIRRCRRCGELFVPSPFGINLVVVSVRRCSVCGRMTPLFIWGDGPGPERREPEVDSQTSMRESDEDEVLKRRIEESKYDRP